jgi:hypothetical protein
MPVDLVLYTTSGCHLCEQAEDMIIATLPPASYQLELVEISDSNDLIAAYGVRIPVLRRPDLGEEIGWPFQPDDIERLVSNVLK